MMREDLRHHAARGRARRRSRPAPRAIGFIFWPKSPRFIDPYRARAIAAALPPFVTPVGVFVNQPVDVRERRREPGRLGAVQLHGDETPAYAAGDRRAGDQGGRAAATGDGRRRVAGAR